MGINEFEIKRQIFLPFSINNNVNSHHLLRARYLPDISCKFYPKKLRRKVNLGGQIAGQSYIRSNGIQIQVNQVPKDKT